MMMSGTLVALDVLVVLHIERDCTSFVGKERFSQTVLVL